MKIIVAMSGGVDSSVTAALLVEKGHEVIGVTMQIWDPAVRKLGVEDARRVAELLGIPHYVMNFWHPFKEKVVSYFVGEYLYGRTPNPCVRCNRYIKFDAFLKKALSLDADFIATGHYARLYFDQERGRYLLCRAKDKQKDQTYVLYSITQNQAAHILMPLGDYTKEEIRQIAKVKGLPVAQKAESQEICFISGSYRDFLRERVKEKIKPGFFLNMQGRVIGQHKGIPFYTIGQRRGLGLAFGERVYVVDIDPEQNAVVVGPEKALYGNDLIAKDNNFILVEKLEEPMKVYAQIRYNARPSPALITPLENGRIHVHFDNSQRAITPGQAVVYYQGNYLVGGGIIERKW